MILGEFCIFAHFFMKKIICYIILSILFTFSYGQKKSEFQVWEDSLIHLRDQVMAEPDETTRLALNEDFMTLLEEVFAKYVGKQVDYVVELIAEDGSQDGLNPNILSFAGMDAEIETIEEEENEEYV